MEKIEIIKAESFEQILNFFINTKDVYESLIKRVDINEYVVKILNFSNNYFIKCNDEIKGFISFYANDRENQIAFITQIACSMNSRKCGYGGKLLDFAVDYSKKENMKFIKLEVNKNNFNAISFYEKKGFKTYLQDKNSFFMEKEL